MSKFSKIILFSFAFWCVICLTVIAASISSLVSPMALEGESPLGLVKIEGPLYNGSPVIKELDQLSKDNTIKGILLRIESPGGAVAAAQEIYTALEELRADSFPVVVSYGNIAASGGYYASLPAERIFANSGTLTGSIGVITQFLYGEELMQKIGVGALTVTSGNLKDAGNPYRAPKPEDIAYLKNVIDDTHAQFVEAVSKWRNIPLDSLKPIADGRVMTGRMALARGLVDTLGSMNEAVRWLSQRCELDSVPKNLRSVVPPKPWLKEMVEGLDVLVPSSFKNHAKVLWLALL